MSGVTDDAAMCMLCMQVVTTMSVIAAAVALRSARLYAREGAVHRHVVLTFATSGRL